MSKYAQSNLSFYLGKYAREIIKDRGVIQEIHKLIKPAAMQAFSYTEGSYTTSGNGTDLQIYIPHSLGTVPSYFFITPNSEDAGGVSWISATEDSIIIHYTMAPSIGTNNLKYLYTIK